MTVAAPVLAGRVTFVTGPDKGSGKTAFLNYSLGLLRRAGEAPAFLGVGLDGEGGRAADVGGRGPGAVIPCMPGELFLSASRYLRASDCEPEIEAVLPGSGALGRLAIARARRPGLAVLVGPEGNELAAAAIAIMRDELGARSVLVDGALNRITQVSSFAGARFFFAMSAGPGDLDAKVRALRRLAFLARLPALGEAARDGPGACAEAAGLPTPARYVGGPLTRLTADRIDESVRCVIVEDFTKVFLSWEELRVFLRGRSLAAVHAPDFGGFVLRLKGLARESFAAALDDPALEELIAYNPYEAAPGA